MTDTPIHTAREALDAALEQVHAHCANFVDPVAAIQCADAIRALASRVPAEPATQSTELHRQLWQHAARLSIAEGAPGWEIPTDDESEAMRAVRELRNLAAERTPAGEVCDALAVLCETHGGHDGCAMTAAADAELVERIDACLEGFYKREPWTRNHAVSLLRALRARLAPEKT